MKTCQPIDIDRLLAIWQEFCINIIQYNIPTPAKSAIDKQDIAWECVYYPADKDRINFWLICDSLRKGAAYNAWQITKL